ncbi:unnamed protein product [Closterium sp. NIES-64]|nr:unnamed protein product [Closterium sp. NIES-64]
MQRHKARGLFSRTGGSQGSLDWTRHDSTSPCSPTLHPCLLSPRPNSRVKWIAASPAAFQDRRALSVAVVGRAGEWPFATDWSSQAIGAEFRRAKSGRGTVAATATPAGWTDLSLTDEEIRDGIALEAELRGRDRRRNARRARDDAELVAGPAEVFGGAGGGESEREIAVEGPRRGVPGKGRNAAKRSAKKAKDYGSALVELKGKELQRVVRWMDLPEETLEAVQLAQLVITFLITPPCSVLFPGGLLRGVSEERMDEAIFAAKSGVLPSFVEESRQGEGEMVGTEGAMTSVRGGCSSDHTVQENL